MSQLSTSRPTASHSFACPDLFCNLRSLAYMNFAWGLGDFEWLTHILRPPKKDSESRWAFTIELSLWRICWGSSLNSEICIIMGICISSWFELQSFSGECNGAWLLMKKWGSPLCARRAEWSCCARFSRCRCCNPVPSLFVEANLSGCAKLTELIMPLWKCCSDSHWLSLYFKLPWNQHPGA